MGAKCLIRALDLGGAALLMTIGSPLISAQTVHHVPPGESIQAAIDAAEHGDTILVSAGTYEENIDYKGKEIAILGSGWRSTFLKGNLSESTIIVRNGQGPATRLQGFTIRAAYFLGAGGGIYAESASPTVSDCHIYGAYANSGGGGIFGDPIVERCAFLNNDAGAAGSGGAIYGAPTVRNCLFFSNGVLDGGAGGALSMTGGSVTDSVFVANGTGYAAGAAIAVAFGKSALIERCVIVANYSDCGCTVIGNARIVSCTIVGNDADICIGPPPIIGGVCGASSIENTIVRDNEGEELFMVGAVSYSNVEGGAVGIGNFDLDALFVDPSWSIFPYNADVHLQQGSPCIDAGDPTLLDPDGTRLGVGAHYFQSLYTKDSEGPLPVLSWNEISLHVGGEQILGLLPGAEHAGKSYVMLGTMSGTSPGFFVQGFHVPLNPDPYMVFTFTQPMAPFFIGFTGALDASGRATAQVSLPASDVSVSGITLHHAYGVFDDSGALVFVSNAEALSLMP